MKWPKRLLLCLLELLTVLTCVFGSGAIELFIPSYTGQIRAHEMQRGNTALKIEGSEEMRFYPWNLFHEEDCVRLYPGSTEDNFQYSMIEHAITRGFSLLTEMEPSDAQKLLFPVLYDEKLDMYFVQHYAYETAAGTQRFLNAVIQNDTLIYFHCAADPTATLEESTQKSAMEQLTRWAMEDRHMFSEDNLIWNCIAKYEIQMMLAEPDDLYQSPWETSTKELRCTMLPCGSEIFIMIDCPLSLNMMFYDPTLNQITGYGVKGS